jgi:hypothetical protein
MSIRQYAQYLKRIDVTYKTAMDGIKNLCHLRIKRITMVKNFGITRFYGMASIVVVGFIRIEIPDGSNVFFAEKVFEKKKLSEVCDIACVSVLQRGCFKT